MKVNRLKDLSDLYGISSYEHQVSTYIENDAKEKNLSYQYDALGSIITHIQGSDERFSLMLAAHMDEVGFQVKSIDENGFIKLDMVGSIWPHMLLGQPFVVVTQDHKTYQGIIGSMASHGMPAEKRKQVVSMDEVYLDLGVSCKQKVLDLGIQLGDMVVPLKNFHELNEENYYQGKALDDRYGCAVIMDVIDSILESKQTVVPQIYGAYSTQEEPGLRGARTVTGVVAPSISIAIDTTVAGDTPLDHNCVKLGGGVVLGMLDSNTIYHRRFIRYIEQLAKDNDIPYQYAVFNKGGTDAGNIHKIYEGSITLTLSLPIRYMHTNTSIINTKDADACIALIQALIKDLSYEKFLELEGY